MAKPQEICDLIAQGENEKVEFRAKPKKPKDLSRLIGAIVGAILSYIFSLFG